jgi:hypothetical protein
MLRAAKRDIDAALAKFETKIQATLYKNIAQTEKREQF